MAGDAPLIFLESNLRWLSITIAVFFAATAHADGPVTAIAFAPGGKQVLLGSQRGIEIRTWPELARLHSLETQLVNVHDLQFSPNGKQLLAAGGAPADSGRVEVWSWPEGKLLHSLADHTDVVYRVAWSLDGTHWASCSGDARCFVYSSANVEKRTQYLGHSRPVLCIRWIDSASLMSVGVDQTVRWWDSNQGTHQRTLDNHLGCVNDLAVRPVIVNQNPVSRQEVIATISEDLTVRLWQPRIGRLMRFTRLDSPPRCVVWNADGSQLWVGCNDGRIRIINGETLETLAVIESGVGRVFQLSWDSSGDQLLIAGEKGFRRHSADAKPVVR